MQVKLTKDGTAYYYWNGKRSWVWVECWNCGERRPPETVPGSRSADGSVCARERLQAAWMYQPAPAQRTRFLLGCSVCGATAPLFEATETARHSTSNEKCGGACLNGKRSCNCKCRGKCHGAGECKCGNPS